MNNLLIHRKVKYLNIFKNEIIGIEWNITREIHIGIKMIDHEFQWKCNANRSEFMFILTLMHTNYSNNISSDIE